MRVYLTTFRIVGSEKQFHVDLTEEEFEKWHNKQIRLSALGITNPEEIDCPSDGLVEIVNKSLCLSRTI